MKTRFDQDYEAYLAEDTLRTMERHSFEYAGMTPDEIRIDLQEKNLLHNYGWDIDELPDRAMAIYKMIYSID